LVVRGLLRASLTATVLVVLYFTLPLTGSLDGSAAVRLVVGLLAFAAVVTWQIRAVLRSRYPGLRAVEALAAAIPLFLLVFAAAYLRMADADAGAFTEPLKRCSPPSGSATLLPGPTWPGSPPWSRCWATCSWSGLSCGSCSAR
jgi:voltage-gated potassium channel